MNQLGLSQYIRMIILMIDFFFLNLLLAVLLWHNDFNFNDGSSVPTWQVWTVVLFSFVLCSRTFKPILYFRIIKGYEIAVNVVLLALKNCILAGVLFAFVFHFLPVDFFFKLYGSFCLVLLVLHYALRNILRVYRKNGGNSRSVVLVGNTAGMRQVYRELTSDLAAGYLVKGYFAEEPREESSVRYLGTFDDVVDYLKDEHVERVYCNLSLIDSKQFNDVMNFCENHLIRFFAVPSFSCSIMNHGTLKRMGGISLVAMRKEPLTQLHNILLKRLFDIVFSALFLVTLFPVILLVVGVGIKISSPGPIFFRQRRNGQMRREFGCFKFRTMRVNMQSDVKQATRDDPRVTKFGRFLRKTSIDELPQFINVLIGDMSVVGPRPHMLRHTEEYSELINKYMVRHYVKPGITGWAQVTGYRGETRTVEEMAGRIRQDIWYIEHWSFSFDLYIIFLTVYNAVKGDRQAY